ncbi:Gfo/Idh/MocA family protein [Paenibacillus sp. TAF58]
MDKVRWGIIGCGDVTEVKSGPALQKAEGSELVAVMRRNGALAEDYAKRHGVAAWYDDAEALVNDPNVNAIYVATPPGFHREYTLLAARAGKPVYVEKPMARNHAECLEMIAACEEAKVPLFVAYYRRGLAKFVEIKRLLDSGVIGEVRFVQTTFLQRWQMVRLRSMRFRIRLMSSSLSFNQWLTSCGGLAKALVTVGLRRERIGSWMNCFVTFIFINSSEQSSSRC